MTNETKDQAAKRESIRLTKRLTWLLWLPIACGILCVGWLTRLFRTPSPRRNCGRRISALIGIRRKLRGLPAVHSEGKPAA